MGRIISDGIDYSGLVFAEGCFIDTDNVIASGTITVGTATTYTATQDCAIDFIIRSSGGSYGYVQVDGKNIYTTNDMNRDVLFIKKGQTITAESYGTNGSYTVYSIQQGSPITFLSEYASACYSDTEREVGCWLDGKPIYQKTVAISSVSYDGNWHDVAHGIANIDKVVEAKAILTATSGYWYTIPVPRANSNLGVTLEITPTDISYINSWISSPDKMYVTLLYTKTTDTAGSGHLTPTGTPTVHYSTDEQCIGTWVDGKPLYQKTQIGGVTFNGQNWQDTNITNVDTLVKFDGYVLRDGEQVPFGDFNNHLTTSWIVRNHTVKVCVQSNTYGDTVAFGGITVQYTKTTD